MKKIKTTVRWFDGFNREYHPIDFEFGNSYLWMKFDNNKEKEKWIPLVQVRHIDTEIEGQTMFGNETRIEKRKRRTERRT